MITDEASNIELIISIVVMVLIFFNNKNRGMMIKKGFYTSDCSDLLVEIVKIYFENSEYIKCKIRLTNKRNGIFYSTENAKLYKDKIKHWKILKELGE